jgi:D-glycero-alpha-D-manno-heptose-7-phosphate kinase
VLNLAVDLFAHTVITHAETASDRPVRESPRNGRMSIRALDYGTGIEIEEGQEVEYNGTLDLLKAAVKRMGVVGQVDGFVWADTPPGCGVGTSAAVAVCLIEALSCLNGSHLLQHQVAQLAQALETQELRLECGVQDQYAAAYGGMSFMEIEYPQVHVSPVRIPDSTVNELNERLLLIYTGESRLSDQVHRRVIERYESGDAEAVGAMDTLRQTPVVAKNALLDSDFGALAEAISANWEAQKKLHPSITTDLIERAFEVASRAGAAAGKANGAGGGGSITFLCEPGREFAVRSALSRLSGIQILPCNITFQGATSWRAE